VSIRAPRVETWLLAATGLLAGLMGLLAGVSGPLAIGAALAIAFTLVALADLAVGLAIFTFLGLIVVVPNFAGETLSVIKLAALPLLVSWFAVVTRQGSSERTFIGVHPAISLVMVLFLSWATLTYVWAEDGGEVLTSVFRYSLALTLVFVVYTAVRRERDVVLVVAAMLLGAVGAAIYGFLSPAETEFGQLERLSGTLGEANELAAALIVGIGLGGGLLAIAKSPVVRGLTAVAIGFCLLALLQTGSRAGLVALFAMLVAAVVLARGRRLALSLVTLTVLLIGVGYYLMAAPEQSRERVLNPGSGTGRVDIWTVGLRMVEANPIEGVGAGNFPVSSIHYLLQPGSLPNDQYIADSPKVAHNIYLEVLAELGIPGALLFVTLILFGLGCSIAALSRFRRMGDRRLQAMAMAIAVSLVGLLTADFFASEQYERELWLLLGLGPALLAIARRRERELGGERLTPTGA
jgi:O-antigen ligase